MNWSLFYAAHPIETWIIIIIGGAVMGSFLNVVIYRYPIMLEREWNHDCTVQLNLPLPENQPTLNLCFPRSHCMQCKKTLPFWLNIPIVSYLLLRGKCYFCKARFSIQYLLVEILTPLLSVLVVLHYGLTNQTGPLLLFTYCLITLSFIDWKHHFLPDVITLSLMWIGLLFATNHLFISPTQAIFGATVGYLFLWVIAKLYLLIQKKEGMGLGDCKMLAMMGAWMGTLLLLNILFLSSVIALLAAIILIVAKKQNRREPIPFGPFIAIAGWCTLMYGNLVMQYIARIM